MRPSSLPTKPHLPPPPASLPAATLAQLPPDVKHYIRTLERANTALLQSNTYLTGINMPTLEGEESESAATRGNVNDSFVSTASTVQTQFSVQNVPQPNGGNQVTMRERALIHGNKVLKDCLATTSKLLRSSLGIHEGVLGADGVMEMVKKVIVDVAMTVEPGKEGCPEGSVLYPCYSRVDAFVREFRLKVGRLKGESGEVEFRRGFEEEREKGGKRMGGVKKVRELKGLRDFEDAYND